jgi:hypothetical protein
MKIFKATLLVMIFASITLTSCNNDDDVEIIKPKEEGYELIDIEFDQATMEEFKDTIISTLINNNSNRLQSHEIQYTLKFSGSSTFTAPKNIKLIAEPSIRLPLPNVNNETIPTMINFDYTTLSFNNKTKENVEYTVKQNVNVLPNSPITFTHEILYVKLTSNYKASLKNIKTEKIIEISGQWLSTIPSYDMISFKE